MCGIVGYVGRKNKTNEVLIHGLKSLEYRGYDSAGVAVLNEGEIKIIKTKGKVKNLEEKLKEDRNMSSTLGIAHTRWATHGMPNEQNAHPIHQGKVTLVHNGIIENYNEIKKEMVHLGYTFSSDTDTEVSCAYIDYVYQLCDDKLETLKLANQKFRGSFAFGILFEDELDTLYAMRRNSPLILANENHQSFIASDISAILKYTREYIILGQDEIAVLKENQIQIYDQEGKLKDHVLEEANLDMYDMQKGNYKHYMLKEIHEEPKVVKACIHEYLDGGMKSFIKKMPPLDKYRQIHIVACGSAMYAGMVAKSLIESKARLHVEVEMASEYRYKNPILNADTLVILISQSGETADTLAVLQLVNQQNVDTLAIVNVIGSSIARESKYVIYTMAGPEIAVATTKAYCMQLLVLALLSLDFAYIHNQIELEECEVAINEIMDLSNLLEKLLVDEQYKQAGNWISKHQDAFFLGRGLDYALCMEGSLKLKEISYIHCEAYAAGELKHGTISLIEEGTPVIAVATDEMLYEKLISNIKEVKARGAHVTLVCREDFKVNSDFYDERIRIPKINVFVQAIVTMLPLQLLAYQVASLRGCEIDQPRNLAKSVTVE